MNSGSSLIPFDTLFERSLNAIAVHTVILNEGRAVDYLFDAVNPAFEALTGLRAADILGKSVLAVLPETEPIWIER